MDLVLSKLYAFGNTDDGKHCIESSDEIVDDALYSYTIKHKRRCCPGRRRENKAGQNVNLNQ